MSVRGAVDSAGEPPAPPFLPDFCARRSVFVLVVVTELAALVVALAASEPGRLNWHELALISLFAQWISLATAAVLCASKPWLERLPQWRAATCCFLLILIITAAFTAAAHWVTAGLRLDSGAALTSVLIRNLTISAIIGALVLRYFYLQGQLLVQHQAAMRAHLQALQARIRPHFLFNSMNIIATLIEDSPALAEEVVEDLSELFRASLNEVGNEVTLAREMALCERYLRIEELRLGERLEIAWSREGLDTQASIPLLTLQPLLENAIYHGIQPNPEGGRIDITLRQELGWLTIEVANPLPAETPQRPSRGNRMALGNVESRLKALYGDQAHLRTETHGQRYVCRLSYPLPRSATDAAQGAGTIKGGQS